MPDDPKVKFCVRCGHALERRLAFGQRRPVCPQCGYTHFFDPKVAAAVMIADDQGRLLMIQRSVDPRKGFWTIPGGYVDAGEDPEQTAIRECEEETGLVIEIARLLALLPGPGHQDLDGASFVIFYQGVIVGGRLRPGDDAAQVAWFRPDQVPEIAFKTTEAMLARWRAGQLPEP